MTNYPTPNSKNNRVLGMMLSYSLDHVDPLMLIFNEYVSMCEGGWNPTVVLFTTGEWTDKLRRLLRYKMWCYRINAPVELRFSLFPKTISISLGIPHRQYMANEIDNYDVFIYHEDDIIVKYSHLAGYLGETKKLHELSKGESYLISKTIGFQRYRRLMRSGDHHNAAFMSWGEQDVIEQDMLEETPHFGHICIENGTYLSVDGNTHQAMWMATRSQALMWNEKCKFFNHSQASREFMSSFSIFGNPNHGACGMQKIIPGERFSTFLVHHYYQQRHVSWTPTFTTDDDIHAGYHKKEQEVPFCWRPIVNASITEQSLPPTNYTPQVVHRSLTSGEETFIPWWR
jgi:hypothetical protein